MISLSPQMRILLAVDPIDFRRGIDGLSRECREALGQDPFSGTAFVFRNRRGTSLKLLIYDGQGFWLCQKRLSAGRFRWWPSKGILRGLRLDVHELQLLLWNGNPVLGQAAPFWRRVRVVGE